MDDDSAFNIASDGSDFAPVSKATKKPTAKVANAKMAGPKPSKTSKPSKPSKPKAVIPKKRAKEKDENDSEQEQEQIDLRGNEDESLLADTPPKAKKQKLVTMNPVKSPHQKPLTDLVNEEMEKEGISKPKKRVSEQYQKLTQLEHILKRPDTYIGSIESTEKQTWVFNSETNAMEYREIHYVPGLFKIFDEILVNAADNKQNDASMKEIRVEISRENGEISVYNDGKGIPVEIHSKEKVYIPEMIFGHLLAGSNFDDNQKKVTGGRNGYGAKLCNIFSTEFTVETSDKTHKKKYKQTWTENMAKMGKAKITDTSSKDDYTKVSFKPDFEKFGMQGLDDDHEALFLRRVYDLAGTCSGITVYLNNKRLPIKGFKKYSEMYTTAIKKERGAEAASDTSEIITEKYGDRWEVGFAVSDGSFQQVSFVNSIATTVGGTHVNYIADQIVAKLADIVKKKKDKAGAQLKPNQIRNHIFVFVNCLVENPAFSSQTKEQLTTKASQFGSKCQISDDFMKKVAKTEVITNIMSFAQQKADQILKKSDGSRRARMHDPKLTDANKAGTRDGHLCTLILTEGDSAKGMAMAGRAVVGADYFGVFPLRGKLLNVRDASIDQISKNKEIQNIKNFLGLQHKKIYTDTKGLRYGHLMIMTDQDHDGSHIKGLLINFLQVQFPSLLKLPDFLIEFITPIVKVYRGPPGKPKEKRSFYTMPEYLAWKETQQGVKGWEHKYYKGLGTSSTEESQEYFNDLDKHHKDFDVLKEEEEELIDLAFSKKKADARKEWLREFKPGTFFDYSVKKITYTDFINKELILFSMADNIRSIPSVIDGFKPTQRKVLYTCFKRNMKKDVKVVELAGLISGLTAYQHGDVSLQQTIVGLAQSFVGSNNVNCLEPAGQFGTRLQGGADAASARYIYTRLSPFARKLFHAADEPLLKYNTDDDKEIEPEIYVPVVPMLLVNGADGIGTGWSCSIPNYNPEDIVDNLKRRMNGEDFVAMQPWFRGFKGSITAIAEDKFKSSGIIDVNDRDEVVITELPVRVWTQDFKERLEEIIKAEKAPSFIKDYKDYNTHKDVRFVIQMEDKHLKGALEEGLEERFKLSKPISTTNLVAFDPEGRITKYASVNDIMTEFYNYRLRFYQLRKDHMLEEMNRELRRYTNQARFIKMIIDNKLVVSRKKKAVLIAELKSLKFEAFPKTKDASKSGDLEALVEEEQDGQAEEETVDAGAYDYLLGMPIWSLTQERVERLLRQIGDKEHEIDVLLEKSKEDLWRIDLDEFIEEWRNQLAEEQKIQKKIAGGRRTSKKFGAVTAKKRKASDSDSDEEFEVTKSKTKKTQSTITKFHTKVEPLPRREEQKIDRTRKEPQSDIDESKTQMKPATSRDRPAGSKNKDKSGTASREQSVQPQAKPSRTNGTVKKYTIDSDDDDIKNESDDSNGDSFLTGLQGVMNGKPVTNGTSKPITNGVDKSKAQSELSFSKPAAAPKPAPAKKAVPSKKEPAPAPVQSPAAKAYAKKLAKKKTVLSDDEDDLVDEIMSDNDDSEVVIPAKKKAASTAPAVKARAKPAAPKKVIDDESLLRDDDDDEDESIQISKPAPRAGRGRAVAAPKKYAVDIDSDDADDFSMPDDDDDDGGDFDDDDDD